VEDDLIVFPGDATFARVTEARGPGRVYVLKFASSSASVFPLVSLSFAILILNYVNASRHFYWLQDVSDSDDDKRARRVNTLIENIDAPEEPQGDDVQMSEG
jgi:26S proteasome regulatory subunit N13